MSLPSQEVLDDIKNLISEVTGFQEGDENFTICERYCLSHVVHHTYPFVNRTTVKNLINSYVSRFYGHGYFRVSQELNNQIKSFLSNTKLFEKNPQYDIQWCLLSLLNSLSSNLTSLKNVPELLSIDDEENEEEEFDWKEYLLSDIQKTHPLEFSSEENLSSDSQETDEGNEQSLMSSSGNLKKSTNEECQKVKEMEIIFDNRTAFNHKESSLDRRKKIEELLQIRKAERDIENDYMLRKNFSEKFDYFLTQEGITRKSQLISEFELMENILFQFQTGERILLQKGFVTPALTSLTQETLGSYLESLQPYFKIIRSLKDFNEEVTEARYSSKSKECCHSNGLGNSSDAEGRRIPNVLYMYNIMLKKALEPFQNAVTEIVENMANYTLIQMEHKLRPYYFNLMSIFHVHNSASKNWKEDCNWKSSVRILSVLYNAIMDATSTKMTFVYLNLFLNCFQVYLDLIDSWISFLDLKDPYKEFVVAKNSAGKSESKCSEYEICPYKEEIEIGEIPVIDFISEKMMQVGQSLEVLRRLNRFVTDETPEQSSFSLLLKTINDKVRGLEIVKPQKQPPPKETKKKSIFTMKNIPFGWERDTGDGESSRIGCLLLDVLKEEEEKDAQKKEPSGSKETIQTEQQSTSYGEMMNSLVKNPFFKMTFENIGMKQLEMKLEQAKARHKDDELMLIREPNEENSGIYPLHKIITEAVHQILSERVSGACSLVKDIVMKENDLLTHLSLLRSILLFSDSYLIQPFILALFNQPVIWGSAYSLSLHLKECVRGFYKCYADAVSVVLTKNNPIKCENILQVIDNITINYEVKWPLTLIITPQALNKYNEIFRLALKLKWAHWALCNVYFNGKGEVECGSKSMRHRTRLLRFWLLSTLSRVHNYFLAQMIPLDLKLNSCSDLKEIITGHSEFIEKIHHNCLLGEKSPEGRKLILETLVPLCMDLVSEDSAMSETKLSSIENTFAGCNLHLTRLMSSLENLKSKFLLRYNPLKFSQPRSNNLTERSALNSFLTRGSGE